MSRRLTRLTGWLAALSLVVPGIAAVAAPVQLLNVSYDPTRELYRDINAGSPSAGRRRRARTW